MFSALRAFFHDWIEAQAHYAKGDYARAADLFEDVAEANPEFSDGHKMVAAAELLATVPSYTVASDATLATYADPKVRNRLKTAVRAAGLP